MRLFIPFLWLKYRISDWSYKIFAYNYSFIFFICHFSSILQYSQYLIACVRMLSRCYFPHCALLSSRRALLSRCSWANWHLRGLRIRSLSLSLGLPLGKRPRSQRKAVSPSCAHFRHIHANKRKSDAAAAHLFARRQRWEEKMRAMLNWDPSSSVRAVISLASELSHGVCVGRGKIWEVCRSWFPTLWHFTYSQLDLISQRKLGML